MFFRPKNRAEQDEQVARQAREQIEYNARKERERAEQESAKS